MRNGRRRNVREKGITLVALVITIIVLLILAGVTINMALSNNGLIQRAKDASETYAQAEEEERQQISQFAEDIDELTGKTALSEDKIRAVTEKIKDTDPDKQLQKIDYVAKSGQSEIYDANKGIGVKVEGAYSGTGSDRTIYQLDVGAIGETPLNWYVLSADEKGVNLVSDKTKTTVGFRNSAGYDNCLYYLNELSTKLFANEDYGVTADRIHAFNLTDIKTAAEQANAGYKVTENGTERDWNWDTDVMSKLSKSSFATLGEKKPYTDKSYTYHPALYPAKAGATAGTTEVEANNPMYDELPGSKITDSGMQREETGNPADKLTVNNTACWDSSATSWTGKLGTFGGSKIAGELFKSGNSYDLACRCVYAYGNSAVFCLRTVRNGGYLSYYAVCNSNGNAQPISPAFRVVVSVPGSRVDIAEDGTVTLKAKNS